MGDVACFSFSLGKDIMTFGGGMITTKNREIFIKLKKIHSNLKKPLPLYIAKQFCKTIIAKMATDRHLFFYTAYLPVLLFNLLENDLLNDCFQETDHMIKGIAVFRYSSVQAVVGINQLKRLDRLNFNRGENVKLYNELMKNVKGIRLIKAQPESKHVYWKYPLCVYKRSLFIRKMILSGIDIEKVYAYNCSGYRIFKPFLSHCPVAYAVSKELIVLPTHYSLRKRDVLHIVESFKEAVS